MISTDGTTYSSLSVANPSLNYNWNLGAVLTKQPGERSSSSHGSALHQLLGYNIYRGGSIVNPGAVTGTSYTDIGLPNGEYDYYVKAIYDLGESGPSNQVTVRVTLSVEENDEKNNDGRTMSISVQGFPPGIYLNETPRRRAAVYLI